MDTQVAKQQDNDLRKFAVDAALKLHSGRVTAIAELVDDSKKIYDFLSEQK